MMDPQMIEVMSRLAQLQRPQDQTPVMPDTMGARPPADFQTTVRPPVQRSDEELFRIWRDKQSDLSILTVPELQRLEQLTRPTTGGLRPLVPVAPPNPERPYGVHDPQVGTKLWFETAQDADDLLRQMGEDPMQLPGVWPGIPAPLPGALRFRR
jgi:hypothetical protein